MEEKEIIDIFKKKGFNDETIEIILNFIDEFEKVGYTEYVSKDDVVKRIEKNLSSNIEFCKMEKKLGMYESEGKIVINEELKGQEKEKSTLFHELLHCITSFDVANHYCGFYITTTDVENTGKCTSMGSGLNEGTTKNLQRRRDEMVGIEPSNSYPILNQQIENLLLVFDEKVLFDCYFNHPWLLDEMLEEKGVGFEFALAFDRIYYEEGEILKRKGTDSKEARILMAIFREGKNKSVYEITEKPMRDINNSLLNCFGKVETIEEYRKFLEFISRIEEQEMGIDKYDVYGRVIECTKELRDSGVDIEKITEVIDEFDMIDDFKLRVKIDNLRELEKNELLEFFAEQDENEYGIIDEIKEEPSYCSLIEKKFSDERNEKNITFNKILQIGRLIHEHPEIDYDELDIRKYSFGYEEILVLKTLKNEGFIYNFGKILEIKDNKAVLDYESSKEKIELTFNDENELEAAIDNDGNQLDFEERFYYQNNYEYKKEIIKEVLKKRTERYLHLKEMNAPDKIIDKEQELISKAQKELVEVIEVIDRKKQRNMEEKSKNDKSIDDE